MGVLTLLGVAVIGFVMWRYRIPPRRRGLHRYRELPAWQLNRFGPDDETMTENTPRSSTTRLRLRARPTFGPPQAQPQDPLNLLVGTRLVSWSA
ncbi:MAG TPA: hypothetical protein VHR39_03590 [Propionibacteriaceae bacterium]|nr:hypothetical protein [Propionibacteriaceae bacterium]